MHSWLRFWKNWQETPRHGQDQVYSHAQHLQTCAHPPLCMHICLHLFLAYMPTGKPRVQSHTCVSWHLFGCTLTCQCTPTNSHSHPHPHTRMPLHTHACAPFHAHTYLCTPAHTFHLTSRTSYSALQGTSYQQVRRLWCPQACEYVSQQLKSWASIPHQLAHSAGV